VPCWTAAWESEGAQPTVKECQENEQDTQGCESVGGPRPIAPVVESTGPVPSVRSDDQRSIGAPNTTSRFFPFALPQRKWMADACGVAESCPHRDIFSWGQCRKSYSGPGAHADSPKYPPPRVVMQTRRRHPFLVTLYTMVLTVGVLGLTGCTENEQIVSGILGVGGFFTALIKTANYGTGSGGVR
jgi:hypothetical protein